MSEETALKSFDVFFKSGGKATIKAHGFAFNTSGRLIFYSKPNVVDKDIYVASVDVLYIVPSEDGGSK